MEINEFGNDIEESAIFLIDSLDKLHKGNEIISKELAILMVPFYKDQIKENMVMDDFMRIIDYSTIMSSFHVTMVFRDELLNIPLISPNDKYYSISERIDLLIANLNVKKLFKLKNNAYLFFNHL